MPTITITGTVTSQFPLLDWVVNVATSRVARTQITTAAPMSTTVRVEPRASPSLRVTAPTRSCTWTPLRSGRNRKTSAISTNVNPMPARDVGLIVIARWNATVATTPRSLVAGMRSRTGTASSAAATTNGSAGASASVARAPPSPKTDRLSPRSPIAQLCVVSKNPSFSLATAAAP